MRRPAGTGFCWAIISFTLVTAFAVRLTGAFLISGTVVVAIRISLALKLFDYSRSEIGLPVATPGNQSSSCFDARYRLADARLSARSGNCESGFKFAAPLANGAII